MRPYRRIVTAV